VITANCAAASYGTSYVARSHADVVAHVFYLALGAVLTLAGSFLVAGPSVSAVAWIATAALLAVFAGRSHIAHPLHGAAYALAAVVASGLALTAGYGLLAPARSLPDVVGGIELLVLLGLVLFAWRLPRTDTPGSPDVSAVARVVVAAAAAFGAAGAATILVPNAWTTSGAALATVRTVILTAVTFGLSAISRVPGCSAIAVLVSPMLILTGVKIAIEDLRFGRALLLFVDLTSYGIALIVAPRLVRRSIRGTGADSALPPGGVAAGGQASSTEGRSVVAHI
jgi:hypothetical protein